MSIITTWKSEKAHRESVKYSKDIIKDMYQTKREENFIRSKEKEERINVNPEPPGPPEIEVNFFVKKVTTFSPPINSSPTSPLLPKTAPLSFKSLQEEVFSLVDNNSGISTSEILEIINKDPWKILKCLDKLANTNKIK